MTSDDINRGKYRGVIQVLNSWLWLFDLVAMAGGFRTIAASTAPIVLSHDRQLAIARLGARADGLR